MRTGVHEVRIPVVGEQDEEDRDSHAEADAHEQIGGQEVPYYRVHVKIDRNDLKPRQGGKGSVVSW